MTTNPPESQSIETRVTRNEVDIRELKQSISDLRSTVSTLADLVTIQQQEAQVDRQQATQDRTLMFQLIQAIAQGRNGGES